jgi:HTH-type transcriptional regulator/antitoxin HipB
VQDFVVHTPDQLGPLMASFRRARRMSQAELARKLGTTQQAISKLELDPTVVSVERLMKTLAALGVEFVLRDTRSAQVGSRKTASDSSVAW